MKSLAHSLPDKNQNAWQLAVIQLSGWTSLPIMATSIFILQENSFLGAVLTIVVGNAILWFIRLAMILMSQKRQSTMDISKEYFGHLGSYFIAGLLLVSTLVWFIAQTTAASSTLIHLITINESPAIDQFTQMSVFLGIVSSFLCMEGIVLLRRLSTFAFPILLISFFVVIFTLPFELPKGGSAALSLSGLTLVLGTNLGITSDMPTFFRHSQSLWTSIKALTVIQVISLALGLFSLYFGTVIGRNFEVNEAAVLGTGNTLLRVSLIVFVLFSVLCANVANVYSSSVGWEVIAPKALIGRKEYLILGLGLTTIFIMVSDVFSLEFMLNASDSALVNLCLILILGYLIAKWRQKGPGVYEQGVYFIAWVVSSAVNAIQFAEIAGDHYSPLAVGLGLIVLVIILSLGIKELFRKKVFAK